MSTVILVKALRELTDKVSYHIPNRESEGYGMSTAAVKKLADQGTQVILTCDNGISAIEPISLAKELGMTVVVLDHHEVVFSEAEHGARQVILPAADAIINPKQPTCAYPFKLLCAGGITYQFVRQLYSTVGRKWDKWAELLEFAALATVCDVVDLLDENRIIVKNGLEAMNQTANPGLRALIRVTGMEGKVLGSFHLGFVLGPCINASGRLEVADLAVELFLTEDEEEAAEIAGRLHELNTQRRAMTAEGVERVTESLAPLVADQHKVLVVYDETIHESIAGIIAGRVRERYNLPTIILTRGRETAKGSGRSIENYNLFEELLRCRDILQAFGGHPMAAGLSLSPENIAELRRRLNENCSLSEDDVIPVLKIDKQLPLELVSFPLVEGLALMEPYGKGNATPLFGEKGVQVMSVSILGKQKSVLRLLCKLRGQRAQLEAICFDGVDKFTAMITGAYGPDGMKMVLMGQLKDLLLDMVFSVGINEFAGRRSLQAQLKDFRLSEAVYAQTAGVISDNQIS
ncbi:MAG TPA: single-stranded-DNA-specific exonuclease RecJ, partial [Bacillota bacterium]|nr:single-stranded-DNA-specific exonuclease RecJ [Bacillota bacterium]